MKNSGDELGHIVEAVARLTDIVGEISVAGEEQASGIEQINQALVHMDGVTQKNASLVDEATRTSLTMSEQATTLAERIGYFSFSASPDAVGALRETTVRAAPPESGAPGPRRRLGRCRYRKAEEPGCRRRRRRRGGSTSCPGLAGNAPEPRP